MVKGASEPLTTGDGCGNLWIEVITLRYRIGQILSFWNKRTHQLDHCVVTAVSSDGLGFQFRYDGRLYRCSYEETKGKLFRSPYDVPQYQELLRLARERDNSISAISKQQELARGKEYERLCQERIRVEQEAFEREQRILNTPITPSCDNCFHRWSGECTAIRSVLCNDYRAGPVQDYSTHGPTGDNADYRPIWH